MTPAYMPFTHLPAATAGLLAGLVGPVVVYQPIATDIPESLSSLASRGIVDIRTPLTGDEARLTAAVKEFSVWAQQNPSATTPGAAFVGNRRGEVPFFDETVINRIRSEIRRFGGDDAPEARREAEFSARLFLAVAQANDQATDHLDHDLHDFKIREREFLDLLADSDAADFDRATLGAGLWREDPGARMTGQRIRAWAGLAAGDPAIPDLLVTTSRAVIDTLMESGDPAPVETLTVMRCAIPAPDASAELAPALAELARCPTLDKACIAGLAALDPAGDAPALTLGLFAVPGQSPATVLRRLAPAALRTAAENDAAASSNHTLIVLVEADSQI